MSGQRRRRSERSEESRWSYRLAGVTLSVLFRSPESIPEIDPFPVQRVPSVDSTTLVLEVREAEDSGWEILRGGECLAAAGTRADLLGALEWCVTTSVLHQRTDRVVLHAATLATTPSGRGHVLIVGPHGAGKTTLALALGGETSYRLHGDDVALLDPVTGNVEALPRPLYWKAPADPPVGPAYDAGGMRLLPTSVLVPRCPIAPCRAIVFPCRRPAAPRGTPPLADSEGQGLGAEILRSGDSEALMRLAAASFLRGPTAFDAVVRLVRESSHWLAVYDDARDVLGPLVEALARAEEYEP